MYFSWSLFAIIPKIICFLQFKFSKCSFKTFAAKGLCEPSIYILLFLHKSFNLPFLISWNLAILWILVIPFFIFSSFTFKLRFLIVAMAVDIFSIWKLPNTFGWGSFKPPNSSS